MQFITQTTWRAVLLLAMTLGTFLPPASSLANSGEDVALNLYHQGIAAKTMGEREQAFEKALSLLLAQYNQMKEEGSVNGQLCYNIGNCYFNLGQNATAILYYQMAKKLLPLNKKISANLKTARDKRENPVDLENDGIMATLLFFHFKLSAAQQINSLIGTAILTALALLYLMFKRNTLIKYLAILSGLTVTSLCLSLSVDYYYPTNMGILMKTTDIRRGAGDGFAPITPNPLGGGSSLKVLSLENDWYTVELNDGRYGFLPKDDLKLVLI